MKEIKCDKNKKGLALESEVCTELIRTNLEEKVVKDAREKSART